MIVKTVLTDMEYNKNIDDLMENFVVNTPVAKEHVYEINRTIHTVQERNRCIVNTILFK